MREDFKLGEIIEVLIDNEFINFCCKSHHFEQYKGNSYTVERKQFSFRSEDGNLSLSLSWENRLDE